MARVLADADSGEVLEPPRKRPATAASEPSTAASEPLPGLPAVDVPPAWPPAGPPADPVEPSGRADRGPEWDRAADAIADAAPRKETQSLRAKILQKTVYLSAAQGALNLGLPQTATTIAVCSKPLSQAADRLAKKNTVVDKIVGLVESTQSDTTILIGLHLCIGSAFALESGVMQRIMERNAWLQSHPAARNMLAGGLVSMMTLPEKLLVRANIESEDLDKVSAELQEKAAQLIAAMAEHERQQQQGGPPYEYGAP